MPQLTSNEKEVVRYLKLVKDELGMDGWDSVVNSLLNEDPEHLAKTKSLRKIADVLVSSSSPSLPSDSHRRQQQQKRKKAVFVGFNRFLSKDRFVLWKDENNMEWMCVTQSNRDSEFFAPIKSVTTINTSNCDRSCVSRTRIDKINEKHNASNKRGFMVSSSADSCMTSSSTASTRQEAFTMMRSIFADEDLSPEAIKTVFFRILDKSSSSSREKVTLEDVKAAVEVVQYKKEHLKKLNLFLPEPLKIAFWKHPTQSKYNDVDAFNAEYASMNWPENPKWKTLLGKVVVANNIDDGGHHHREYSNSSIFERKDDEHKQEERNGTEEAVMDDGGNEGHGSDENKSEHRQPKGDSSNHDQKAKTHQQRSGGAPSLSHHRRKMSYRSNNNSNNKIDQEEDVVDAESASLGRGSVTLDISDGGVEINQSSSRRNGAGRVGVNGRRRKKGGGSGGLSIVVPPAAIPPPREPMKETAMATKTLRDGTRQRS